MSETALPFLPDPRLADVALAATPAWAWSEDAGQVLWANAAGAGLLGAPTLAALRERRFERRHPVASQIARLAELLPADGTARLERLRGLSPGIGRLLTCSCARMTLADGTAALLITATEAAGPTLSPGERLRRLLDGFDGAFAAFSPEAALLFAAPAARGGLGERATLAALGAMPLCAPALAEGEAVGDSALGRLTLRRIGNGNTAVLIATLDEEPAVGPAPAGIGEASRTQEVVPAHLPAEEATAQAEPETGPGLPPETAAVAVADEPAPVQTAQESEPAAPSDEIPVAAETVAATDEPERDMAAAAASEDAGEPEQAAAAPSAADLSSQPEAEPPQAGAPPAPSATPLPALPERRHPLRFVWHIDAENRLNVASEEFIALMGPQIAGRLGRPWADVTEELGLDPTGRLGEALAARDTFSGVAAAWPIEGSQSLAVELSGLPLFDRDRKFCGYRGFGVCRDVGRLNAIAAERREAVASARAAPAEPAALSPEGVPAAPGEATIPLPEDAAVSLADAGAPEAAAAEETTTPEAIAAPDAPASEAEREQAEPAQPALPPGERPLFTVVPPSKNVVPFRTVLPVPADKRPGLTSVERTAFQEIAKALGARMEGEAEDAAEAGSQATAEETEGDVSEPGDEGSARRSPSLHRVWPRPIPSAYAAGREPAARLPVGANGERAVLDRLPVGVLVYRGDALLHANRALLDWTGYEDVEAIAAAGGLERLFAEPGVALLGEPGGSGQRLAVTARRGDSLPVECRLFSVTWHDGTALMIVLQRAEAEERARAAEQAADAAEERTRAAQAAQEAAEERTRQTELALRAAQAATRELESILETATDGVLVVDRDGIILSHNRSVEALFGHNAHEFTNRSFVDLFAPESHRAAQEYLNGLIRNGVASMLNDGREVIGRVREGGLMPLFMTIGRIADDKFCIVFRDITQWKRAEEDLTNAKREAEKASSAKSDFLAKVSHEIRTPLNAIIGFAEVMMEQRFGPIANDRYLQYLKDIRTSGEHVISLVNDLLDLSKIEAGKLELTFASVSLSEVVNQCVAIMQPQANRERIIIRTSLMPTLPPVVADERSMRQIVLNLLSNSIKFTGAGGQVIVSTALTDQGEAILRVRDTGIGMSEKEIATAMEPFRQVVSSGRSEIGTGLGLPLTKALAEANRASFAIKSAVDAGTLVEICFPATRVLAE